jgi:hypothetical protein
VLTQMIGELCGVMLQMAQVHTTLAEEEKKPQ